MEKFREDLVFGKQKEEDQFEIIKDCLDKNLVKSEKKNALFDFYSETSLIELKSRRNNYNHYPTTMVGYNKIEYGLKSGKDIYFCFSFLDGLYYYKFSKTDKLEFSLGGRRDRGKNEIKEYCFIPIELLIKI